MVDRLKDMPERAASTVVESTRGKGYEKFYGPVKEKREKEKREKEKREKRNEKREREKERKPWVV